MDVIVRAARRAFRVTDAKSFKVTDGRLEVLGSGERDGETVAVFAPGAWRSAWHVGSARPVARARRAGARGRRAAAAGPTSS